MSVSSATINFPSLDTENVTTLFSKSQSGQSVSNINFFV